MRPGCHGQRKLILGFKWSLAPDNGLVTAGERGTDMKWHVKRQHLANAFTVQRAVFSSRSHETAWWEWVWGTKGSGLLWLVVAVRESGELLVRPTPLPQSGENVLACHVFSTFLIDHDELWPIHCPDQV
jgi:hypothetical protein